MQCLFDNGQHVVLGAGELHLEVCLQDLEDEHAGVAIKVLITFHTRFQHLHIILTLFCPIMRFLTKSMEVVPMPQIESQFHDLGIPMFIMLIQI